jgi:TRAP-type C4-dicarboxylate transport system substrate-binding protein
MRIRVIGLPLFMDFFKALGAAPVQLNLTGVPDALQKKAIDGQDNPLSVFTGFKFNEMGQKYLTVWNYPAEPIFIAVNKNVWNNWSRDDQQRVREAAEQAMSETAPILTSQAAAQAVDETVGQLEQAGVQVTRLTDPQKAAFKSATTGVLQNWSERIGQDLITIANADIKRGPTLPPASDPAAVPQSGVPASPNPEPPPVDEAAPAATGGQPDKAGQSTPAGAGG